MTNTVTEGRTAIRTVEAKARGEEPPAISRSVQNHATFRAWYESALPRVYTYLFHRCGRNRELAEELTQQAFVEAVRSGHEINPHDSPNWVIGIARHRLLDHYRRVARRERAYMRLVATRPPQAIWMDVDDDEGRLADALARLPATQRAALVLRYMDDLPVREVAALLGRSEGAVESLLSRGRDSLRRILGEDD